MIIQYKLKTKDIFDLDSRLAEVQEIREWICELVEWKEDLFEIRYHSSGSRLSIWFENEKHAIMCALRWTN